MLCWHMGPSGINQSRKEPHTSLQDCKLVHGRRGQEIGMESLPGASYRPRNAVWAPAVKWLHQDSTLHTLTTITCPLLSCSLKKKKKKSFKSLNKMFFISSQAPEMRDFLCPLELADWSSKQTHDTTRQHYIQQQWALSGRNKLCKQKNRLSLHSFSFPLLLPYLNEKKLKTYPYEF